MLRVRGYETLKPHCRPPRPAPALFLAVHTMAMVSTITATMFLNWHPTPNSKELILDLKKLSFSVRKAEITALKWFQYLEGTQVTDHPQLVWSKDNFLCSIWCGTALLSWSLLDPLRPTFWLTLKTTSSIQGFWSHSPESSMITITTWNEMQDSLCLALLVQHLARSLLPPPLWCRLYHPGQHHLFNCHHDHHHHYLQNREPCLLVG